MFFKEMISGFSERIPMFFNRWDICILFWIKICLFFKETISALDPLTGLIYLPEVWRAQVEDPAMRGDEEAISASWIKNDLCVGYVNWSDLFAGGMARPSLR